MIPNLPTPVETQNILSARLKQLRLASGFKRSTLSKRAGVSESSLKRFETTGKVSLSSFLRIAHALGRLDELSRLFLLPEAASVEELRKQVASPLPKRGKI